MIKNQEVQTKTTNEVVNSNITLLRSLFATRNKRARGSQTFDSVVSQAQVDLKHLQAYLPKLINCPASEFPELLLSIVPNTSTKARHLTEGIAKKLERLIKE